MEPIPMKTDKQLEEEIMEIAKKKAKTAEYNKRYRAKNLPYIREYQKQWERENRSVLARKQGRYNKGCSNKLEVKKAPEGGKFLVIFD